MKNIYFLIIGLLLVVFANSQQQTMGLISSLSNSEINSINTKIYGYNNMIVSNNYQHYASKHRSRKHSFNTNIGESNQTTLFHSKDTTNRVKKTLATTEDSTINTNSNKCCMVKYFLNNKGIYKYGVHVEGKVQDCEEKVAIPHAYVSLNSAVVPGKYLIIPTTNEGKFNIDVVDDSLGSITVIKKGYADKEVKLQDATVINENTSYAFNVCLDKEVNNDNKQIKNEESNPSNLVAYFGFNKSTLNRTTRNMLDSLIKSIKHSKERPSSIELNGYTDSKGHKKYNLELSRERAIECRRYLLNHGLAHVKVKVHAYGSSNPLEKELLDNNLDNPKARAMNRRVEIVINHK